MRFSHELTKVLLQKIAQFQTTGSLQYKHIIGYLQRFTSNKQEAEAAQTHHNFTC